MNVRSHSLSAPGERTLPIKFFLDLLVFVCGLMCFMMARDGISIGAGWVFLGCFAAAECVALMDLPRPPGALTFGAALLLLIAILMQINMRRVAEPLMEAVLLLYLLRVVEGRRPREYAQTALILLAAVIIYALLSVERLFLTICVGISICSSLILILAAWMQREPDARLSWRDMGSMLKRALWMFVLMLPLCLLLFFIAPRFRNPFLFPRGGFGAFTGFSDQLSLGEIGTIQESGRLAFRAEMENIAPRTPYWRGVVLSWFNGDTWTVNLAGRHGGWGSVPEGAELVHQTIQIEPSGHRWLFTLDRPTAVRGDRTMHLGNGTYTRRMFNTSRYEVDSVLTPMAGELSSQEERLCLQLPENYSPAIRSFTDEVTRGLSGSREKMDAIVARLRGGEYSWSLSGLARGPDALEDFLLRLRRGNCEYFASAAGVMLRMAGVPARLVGGYRGGEYNRAGGFYAVHDAGAHVWVEAWDRAEQAWIRLDPTPAGVDGMAAGATSSGGGWSEFWDYLDYQWNRYFVTYSSGEPSQWGGALRSLLRGAGRSSSFGGMDGLGSAVGKFAMPLGVTALLVCCGWYLWRLSRRDPREILVRKFERLAARRGFVRLPSQGLEEFALTLPEPMRRPALDFASGMNAVLYGGRQLDAERRGDLARALGELSSLKAGRSGV